MNPGKGHYGQSFEALYPRLLHFGVAYGDLLRINVPGQDWARWGRALAERGAAFEAAGERARLEGREVTAVEFHRRAVNYFHYAQIKVSDSPEKREWQARCRRNFARLAPLIKPAAVRLEVPFKVTSLPGYLQIAEAGAPCVVLIGGLDSAKEVELSYFAETFLRRGNTVFFFDGPGQGELLGRLSIRSGFDAAVSAVIDRLSTHPEIDGNRIGLFGVSFGGYLACHAAAADERVKACVCLGGFYDSRIFPRLPPVAVNTVKRAFGLGEDESLESAASEVTLDPLRGRMDRPLLVVHGSEDYLVDAEQVEALGRWACGPHRVWIIEGAEHVCTDRFHECLPEIGDWVSRLLADSFEPPLSYAGRGVTYG